jgi:RNA polymerase sigma factor (sigma-70 family)
MTQGSVPGRRPVPPTRKSLLIRLKDWSDQDSWQEFCKIYEKVIYDVALKAGLRKVEAQEVVQETLLSVAKKIAGFDYNPEIGSFKNWLLKITKRRIVDQLRKRRPATDTAEGTTAVRIEQLSDSSVSALEAAWDEEWRGAMLDMARAVVKRHVGARQYKMFDLYVIQQLPMKKVTAALGVNAAQVYMAKYRISKLLKAEMKNLEADAR